MRVPHRRRIVVIRTTGVNRRLRREASRYGVAAPRLHRHDHQRSRIVELLARGNGRHFDPLDDDVDIEVSVGQNTPQRTDRIDDLAIGAGDKHPQQRQHLWHEIIESIGHRRSLAPCGVP